MTFKFEVLQYKSGSLDFNVKAAIRMQIKLYVAGGLVQYSILHTTVSVQLNHMCESTRMLACHVLIRSI
jgi:hypothetical protein